MLSRTATETDEKAGLVEKIKDFARSLGFFRTGVAPAEKLDGARLDDWLGRGFHGDLAWMPNRRDLRLDPALLLPNARSVIVCAMNYFIEAQGSDDLAVGRISRYAWGDDYHEVLRARLKKLLAFIQQELPQAKGRVFVDSAPVWEKVWAVRAGIGWQGKHSNVITRDFGSWFFLGEVIVDVELSYDEPFAKNYCGTCTACIDACPTRAIVEPGVVDARRCISYLTIELKPELPHPPELAPLIGNHIFGCDICQQVCPWNRRFARPTEESAFQPRTELIRPGLSEWKAMNMTEFDRLFPNSPVRRVGLVGLKRNVLTALGNYQRTAAASDEQPVRFSNRKRS